MEKSLEELNGKITTLKIRMEKTEDVISTRDKQALDRHDRMWRTRNMARGRINQSSCWIDENLTNGWDSDKIRDHVIVGNICNNGKHITWNNSYELLKKFVKTAFTQSGVHPVAVQRGSTVQYLILN